MPPTFQTILNDERRQGYLEAYPIGFMEGYIERMITCHIEALKLILDEINTNTVINNEIREKYTHTLEILFEINDSLLKLYNINPETLKPVTNDETNKRT